LPRFRGNSYIFQSADFARGQPDTEHRPKCDPYTYVITKRRPESNAVSRSNRNAADAQTDGNSERRPEFNSHAGSERQAEFNSQTDSRSDGDRHGNPDIPECAGMVDRLQSVCFDEYLEYDSAGQSGALRKQQRHRRARILSR
jgi:hypothetical protein